MPVSVVQFFEVIDVDENNGYTAFFAIAARGINFTLRYVQNHPAVPQASERIVRGLEAHFFAGFYQVVFETQYPFASAQARTQFLRIEWLCKIIAAPDSRPAMMSSFD